jgi:uncharacterized caspase-like protein
MKRLLFVLLVASALAAPASAEKRVARVVGNSTYKSVAQLDNPNNDAALMTRTLKALGFVIVGGDARTDLDKRALDEAVQAFGRELQGADVAMFYYAGHGVQIHGSNYLVPIDANPTREADVDFQMLDVNVVMNQMQGSGTRLNVIVLDACRNNPFGGRGLPGAPPPMIGGMAHEESAGPGAWRERRRLRPSGREAEREMADRRMPRAHPVDIAAAQERE